MRGTDVKQWVKEVAKKKREMDGMVSDLRNYGARVYCDLQTKNVAALNYRIRFFFDHDRVMVTMRIVIMDWQTNSDVVIASIVTLPDEKRRHGFASRAIDKLLQWAKQNGLFKVRATQVSGMKNENFWLKNGFAKMGDPNPCNDFVRLL